MIQSLTASCPLTLNKVQVLAGSLQDQQRLGLLPSTFNPPTMAHLSLAEVAQETFDLQQVVYVLPEILPHKKIEKPTLEQRMEWISVLARSGTDRAAASCKAGLVIEIVQVFRECLPDSCEIYVISGRDAAERYQNWGYGDGTSFSKQLQQYQLLVAARDGSGFTVDSRFSSRIHTFEMNPEFDHVSSSMVRQSIRSGGQWQQFVPIVLHDTVGQAYGE